MIQDQANELRRLARELVATATPPAACEPRLVVAASGKGGVGTTTVAVNLAAALTLQGRRAVYVDADPHGAGAANFRPAEGPFTVADVLAARRPVRDVLQTGPAGVRFVPGSWGLSGAWDCSSAAQERLIAEIRGLGEAAEVVLVDAGTGCGPLARRFWHAADHILLVTTPELPAVMNAYASIKMLAAPGDRVPIHPVVNMASSQPAAEEAGARLDRAGMRLLGLKLEGPVGIVWAEQIAETGRRGELFVLARPRHPATRQIRRLAARLSCGSPSGSAYDVGVFVHEFPEKEGELLQNARN
jgi:flagellar biosynthesis protein FlhG